MTRAIALVPLLWLLLAVPVVFAADAAGGEKLAPFPRGIESYERQHGIGANIVHRAQADPFNVAALVIFLCAIAHTFGAGFFTRLSHKIECRHREKMAHGGRAAEDRHHGNAKDVVSFRVTLFHFLGEVEAIFGIWVIGLAAVASYFYGVGAFRNYVSHDVVFTEPMFVVVIMAIASSRPVIRFAEQSMQQAAGLLGGSPGAWWLSVLTIGPVLGSLITEPAAMTICGLLLAKRFFELQPKPALAYATLGLLFVNISVGGTFTHFAAPPVLMVAGRWGWDTAFLFQNFGWKALVGILVCNAVYFGLFRGELARLNKIGFRPDRRSAAGSDDRDTPVPAWVTLTHLLFLAWTVYNSHYPALFLGGFLFFLAFVEATGHHQNPINLRSPLLVGFFLAGLVIHGGCQGWWIEPIISELNHSPWTLLIGASVLTAFNDNAAITFLASTVPGISTVAQYAVVAGAVAGGGLTVIANAPNPAGQTILKRFFPDSSVSPGRLALAAAFPTVVMICCFMFFSSRGMNPAADGTGDSAAVAAQAGAGR